MTQEEKQFEIDEIKKNIASLTLNDISDDALSLCVKIANDSRFKYEFDINDDDKRIIFRTNIDRPCFILNDWKNSLSIQEMSLAFSDPAKYDSTPLFSDESGWKLRLMFPHDSLNVCKGCDNSECLTKILFRVVVLKEFGELETKIEQRNKHVGYFKFEWNPPDGLRRVPESIFKSAKLLVDRSFIWVPTRIGDDQLLKIQVQKGFPCSSIQDINEEWLDSNFKSGRNLSDNLTRLITRPLNYLCGNLECRLSHCVFMVAGYLYYLQKSGQSNKIDEDRTYYHEHESEILSQEESLLQDKINKYLSSQVDNDILSKFEPLKDHVENIDLLAQAISNKNRTNICFAIEREDGVDESQTVAIIEDALRAAGKIQDSKDKKDAVLKISLVKLNEIINEKREKIQNNKLYVISQMFGYVASKQNVVQVDRIVDCLCSSNKNQYILMVGTHEELYGTNGLFSIDPKIKYIYEHFKIAIRNLTIDELYEIYKKNIDPLVSEYLNKDEVSARKKFDDFVINNRSLIPFKNEDLAKYLARYSNSCGNVDFPPYSYKYQTLDESLSGIVGLNGVKKKMKDLEKYILFMNKSKAIGAKIPPTNLHMIFNGNPGTGKTVMARIMARMLYDIGAIKENKLIEVERKDLVGSYVGQTAPKTADIINKAIGGVLFIDEAYTLTPTCEKDYGSEAIATLIKAMEDLKDELVVIFAGYKDEMRHFVNANPGIASRIGYTFDFDDYSTSELLEILKKKLSANNFTYSDDFLVGAEELIRVGEKRKNFGNGRFIDRLIQEVLMNHSVNAMETNDILSITANDLPTIENLNGEYDDRGDVNEALGNIIGMNNLKDQIRDFVDYVGFSKKASAAGLNIPTTNMHMLFTGNPGTGKTMTARIMTKMLYDIGVIHENKLVEVSYEDFADTYGGGPAQRTADTIDKAMGGVLFIDEAYNLATVSHWASQEIITALIKSMEDHKGELIIIFAGYKNEMKRFVDSNPGIASRIGYTFHFDDYTPEELLQIYQLKMNKAGFVLTDEANDAVFKLMRYFGRVENIGNGRFVDRVVQNTIMKHSRQSADNLTIITELSIPSIDEIINTLSNASSLLQPNKVNANSLRKTAIHEIGHAYLRYKLYQDPQILKITINAEGCGTLGYVQYKADYKPTHSKTELMNIIQVSLAGMGSEEVFNGEFENGNATDLEKATGIARDMVTRYGMSKIGIGQIGNEPNLAVMVQNEINRILNECYQKVKATIEENKGEIGKLVDYLLDHKELTGDEFINIIKEIQE